jgi:hypothetical protein
VKAGGDALLFILGNFQQNLLLKYVIYESLPGKHMSVVGVVLVWGTAQL